MPLLQPKENNYAQLFLANFNYRKTRVFTNNKDLSHRLYEEANILRMDLDELAKNEHTLDNLIQVLTKHIKSVREERDRHVQSVEKKSLWVAKTTEECRACHSNLDRDHYQVTPTFFSYKPASFEAKTAYAMYRISTESTANSLLTAILEAFKTLAFKLGLWIPKAAPKNESIDQFLKWMWSLQPKQKQGQTYDENHLHSCTSTTCNPVQQYEEQGCHHSHHDSGGDQHCAPHIW